MYCNNSTIKQSKFYALIFDFNEIQNIKARVGLF